MRDLSEVEERNFAKEPLTAAEVGEMLDAVGSVAGLLNTRHPIAKKFGWKADPPARDVFVAAAVEDNKLVRRPIAIRDGKAVVGFDREGLKALFA